MEAEVPDWWLGLVLVEMERRGWRQANLARHLIGLDPMDTSVPSERENDFSAAKKRVSLLFDAYRPPADRSIETAEEIRAALNIDRPFYIPNLKESLSLVIPVFDAYEQVGGNPQDIVDVLRTMIRAKTSPPRA